MNKVLYITPGWEDDCGDKQYQHLAVVAKSKGYEVVCKNVDWKTPLSHQVFTVPPNAVIFGFSLGAILAWLVAQKSKCQHIVLASMTPHYSFTEPKIKKAFIDLAGALFVEDISANLTPKHQALKQTILYGDLEEEKGDILVLKTGHNLTDDYINVIQKIL